jgi:hypothetical protein
MFVLSAGAGCALASSSRMMWASSFIIVELGCGAPVNPRTIDVIFAHFSAALSAASFGMGLVGGHWFSFDV